MDNKLSIVKRLEVFCRVLESTDFNSVASCHKPYLDMDGKFIFPVGSVGYVSDVVDFIGAVNELRLDLNIDLSIDVDQFFDNKLLIGAATEEEVLSILVFIVRRERFFDGFIGRQIFSGFLHAVLKRFFIIYYSGKM